MPSYFTNTPGPTSAGSTATTSSLGDITGDITMSSPPEDSISDLEFSTKSDLLAVASWDKRVRIYDVSQTGVNSGKAIYAHGGPVLSVAWSNVLKSKPLFIYFSELRLTCFPIVGW